MKANLVLACVAILFAIGSYQVICKKPVKINKIQSVSEVAFTNFVAHFKKSYSSTPSEYHHRSAIFRNNLAKIERLNRKEQKNELSSAKYDINLFADMTKAEFKRTRLGLKPLSVVDELSLSKARISFRKMWKKLLKEEGKTEKEILAALPESFDWRDQKGAVTKVKNQGPCGSCWSFATTGTVEGQYKIKRNQSVSLSEQELVDCDTVDYGCDGGLMVNAFAQIIKLGGLVSEEDYPYYGSQMTCQLKKDAEKYNIDGFVSLPAKDEDKMRIWLVKRGPIALGINADTLQLYKNGTLHSSAVDCPTGEENLNHGVLLVGYGQETYQGDVLPYWIIKNSWTANWGEDGYFRIFRGDNTCGLSLSPSSAILL